MWIQPCFNSFVLSYEQTLFTLKECLRNLRLVAEKINFNYSIQFLRGYIYINQNFLFHLSVSFTSSATKEKRECRNSISLNFHINKHSFPSKGMSPEPSFGCWKMNFNYLVQFLSDFSVFLFLLETILFVAQFPSASR